MCPTYSSNLTTLYVSFYVSSSLSWYSHFHFLSEPPPISFVLFLTFLLPIPSLTLSPSLHCLVAPMWKLITWNCQKWKLWTKGKMGQNEWQKKIEEEKKRRWKLIKVAMLHLVTKDTWRGLKNCFFLRFRVYQNTALFLPFSAPLSSSFVCHRRDISTFLDNLTI